MTVERRGIRRRVVRLKPNGSLEVLDRPPQVRFIVFEVW